MKAARKIKIVDPNFNLTGNLPGGARIIFGDDFPTLAEMEAQYIEEVIQRSKGSEKKITRLTGLSLKDFSYKMKQAKKKKQERRKYNESSTFLSRR